MKIVKHHWRFGYGSNLGLNTLRNKKNLNPIRYVVGTIVGWDLYFMPGFDYVEPGWAAVRPHREGNNGLLHGSAFLIPEHEVEALDKQEGGYNVVSCQFKSYEGEIIDDVGLYVPKNQKTSAGDEKSSEGTPSLRYLRLLQRGAREGGLALKWIERLESIPHYITPPEVRSKTNQHVSDFELDPERNSQIWSAEKLAMYDGTSNHPPHTSSMGYVIDIGQDCWVFPSWKGHNITRRNLLQFNGKSMDTGDIRFDQPGYRPLPKISECTEEEVEFLFQNLDRLIHKGGKIVGRYKPFLDDQNHN